MSAPTILDLFSGAGGAGEGYRRKGFRVVGVDLVDQPRYPGERFIQADAIKEFDAILADVQPVAIHASPPCQANVKGMAAVNRSRGRDLAHVELIPSTRAQLRATGLPYVIENVEGSALENPIRLCGSSFGLAVRRHRLFETNFPVFAPPCAHHLQAEKKFPTNWRPNGARRLASVVQVYGNAGGTHLWPEAMGIDWMTTAELTQAIPPAYTEYIAEALAAVLDQPQVAG
jgi:DNA (cytosine-5)-methyltransferase 1